MFADSGFGFSDDSFFNSDNDMDFGHIKADFGKMDNDDDDGFGGSGTSWSTSSSSSYSTMTGPDGTVHQQASQAGE